MREGPYTKFGAITGALALLIGYLSLAATVKWPPFHNHVSRPPLSGHFVPGSHGTERPSPKATSLSHDVWIAQLASVPTAAGISQLRRMLRQVQIEIPGAKYLDSSRYASLKPGFWVVYYRGPFRNGNQALDYCATHGRTGPNQCIGRFLSHQKSDDGYMCFPPPGSQTTGCYHDP